MYKIVRLLALFVVVSSVAYSNAATQVQNVSLIELLIQPEKFDGRTIAVVGFLETSFDGSLLYLHREDSENWILENAIWVHRNELMDKNQGSLNRKYVKVIGKFKVGYKEQLGDPPNGFSEIRDIKLWSDPSSPVGRKKMSGVNSVPSNSP